MTDCGLAKNLFTWENQGDFWERKNSPVWVRVATSKLGPRTGPELEKKEGGCEYQMEILFSPLPLSLNKLEMVREIHFGPLWDLCNKGSFL